MKLTSEIFSRRFQFPVSLFTVEIYISLFFKGFQVLYVCFTVQLSMCCSVVFAALSRSAFDILPNCLFAVNTKF